jgi:hypothetical protein
VEMLLRFSRMVIRGLIYIDCSVRSCASDPDLCPTNKSLLPAFVGRNISASTPVQPAARASKRGTVRQ